MKPNPTTAAQPDDAAMPAGTKTRRPRRMAREAGAGSDAAAADAAPEPQALPRSGTKSAAVIALLTREQGATLAELIEETGWLPHTTRAALTGLRKKGHVIVKFSREGTTCYRIEGAA